MSKFKDSNNEEYFKMMMEAVKNLTSERNSICKNVTFAKNDQPNIENVGEDTGKNANEAEETRPEMDFIAKFQSRSKVEETEEEKQAKAKHEEIFKKLSTDSIGKNRESKNFEKKGFEKKDERSNEMQMENRKQEKEESSRRNESEKKTQSMESCGSKKRGKLIGRLHKHFFGFGHFHRSRIFRKRE